MPVSLSDWLGVLGFTLSLTLAVWAAWEKRTSLRIIDAEMYAIYSEKTGETSVVLTATLENLSAAEVAVTGCVLTVGNLPLPASVRQKLIFGLVEGDEHGMAAAILSTPMPVLLPGKAAARICLQFDHPGRSSCPPSELPCPVVLQSALKARASRDQRPSTDDQSSGTFPAEARLCTTRKAVVVLDFAAQPGDPADGIREARAAKWIE